MILSEKQLASIREANARLNIWHGAVRSGKSYASLWAFFHFLRFGPPGDCAIIGRTTQTIDRNIIGPMRMMLGERFKYLLGRQRLEFFGRVVHVIPAADARAETRVRGSTFVGAYVDEATLIPEGVFRQLLYRLSLKDAKLFATTNPDSPNHWLKRDFLDKKEELNLSEWHFKLEDNPSLDPVYVEQLKLENKGLWYKRFIDGLWAQAEGAIYDFFDESFHTIDYATHNATSYIAGIDYGTSNPFAAVLIGINRNYYPNVWVEKEYYYDSKKALRQKTNIEYADDLAHFFEGKHLEAIYVDPSAAAFKLELMRRGFENVFDAQNEVISGIIKVQEYLYGGTLKICKCCENLIKEFESYIWDTKSSQAGIDKPLKQNDHVLDALRYAIYTHFFATDDYTNLKGPLTAVELDRMYQETQGLQPQLPAFFQNPEHNSPSYIY